MQADDEIYLKRHSDVRDPLRQDVQPDAGDAGDDRPIIRRGGFCGIVQVATSGPCMKGLLGDAGVELEAQVHTDANAAKSIASKRGAGRVRHIEVLEVWVQDRAAKGELTIVKVQSERNLADVVTKHVERSKMDEHMRNCGFVRKSGRHELCPQESNRRCLEMLFSWSTCAELGVGEYL